jgi:hypothetical protein
MISLAALDARIIKYLARTDNKIIFHVPNCSIMIRTRAVRVS